MRYQTRGGVEIKAGRRVTTMDARGLASWAELVPRSETVRRWIVYRGRERQRFPDGTEVWPVLEALAALGEAAAS